MWSNPLTHDKLEVDHEDTLGDGFLGVEIDSSKSNLHGINQTAHSVLTTDFSDSTGHPTLEAYETIMEEIKGARQAERPAPLAPSSASRCIKGGR